jgi:hypothetical protein
MELFSIFECREYSPFPCQIHNFLQSIVKWLGHMISHWREGFDPARSDFLSKILFLAKMRFIPPRIKPAGLTLFNLPDRTGPPWTTWLPNLTACLNYGRNRTISTVKIWNLTRKQLYITDFLISQNCLNVNFSLKLLWAPIVDSLYCRWIGRRKSWMVPCQYLIGAFLLIMSFYVPEILGKEDDKGISSHKFLLKKWKVFAILWKNWQILDHLWPLVAKMTFR